MHLYSLNLWHASNRQSVQIPTQAGWRRAEASKRSERWCRPCTGPYMHATKQAYFDRFSLVMVFAAASMMRPRLLMGLPDASTAPSLGNRDSAAIDMSPISM